jgi:PAS domain S-box-containing protein
MKSLPNPPPRLSTKGIYSYFRHPMYAFFIAAFWVGPVMTFGRFEFALISTIYFFIGTSLEERNLRKELGEVYSIYCKNVPMWIPRFKPWNIFEEIITDVSSKFVISTGDNVDSSVNYSIKIMGEFVRADRSFFMLSTDNCKSFHSIYEWNAKNILSIKEKLLKTHLDTLPYIYNKIKNREVFSLHRLSGLPSNAKREKIVLRENTIFALLMIPLIYSGELAGLIVCSSTRAGRRWSDKDIAILKTGGDIIQNTLKRKEMNFLIKKSETKYRELVENANASIFRINLKGEFTYFNEYAQNFYGYKEEEIMGKKLSETITLNRENAEKDIQFMFSQIVTSPLDFIDLEYINKKKNGKKIWMLWNAKPVFNENNELKEALWVGHDISRLKNIEKKLTQKNRELENTLDKLKQMQKQIIIQEKMASLGSLTAGIAHEIKNPLNFVNNFSELSIELLDEMKLDINQLKDKIQKDKLSFLLENLDAIKSNSNKILKHGKRADSIIQGMLMHSRGTSAKKSPVNINELLEETINLAYHGMRANFPTFNVIINKKFDNKIPLLELISQDTARAFLNIINNACYAVYHKQKANPENYIPEIKVITAKISDSVRIRIRDNGNGISEEKLEKIFDPFYTTKPPGEGTGLGLSIAYDIIEKDHRGHIKVLSRLDEFTEFQITYPMEK